ncbi:MAG: hypothetical protein JWN94_1822 [Betaproteobacteria bacterium]|nr:hypothetical protein [Betaproteobacteria bacterium]
MTDQSSEPAAGDLTSGTAMTYKTFSVSLSDPAFFVASSLPANRFRLKGKAALTVNATDAVFETSRKRFLMFADDDQLTLPLSSVVNVQRTGKKLRLENRSRSDRRCSNYQGGRAAVHHGVGGG